MTIPVLRVDDIAGAAPLLRRLAGRAGGSEAAGMEEAVAAILADVRERGLKAVCAYTRQFDAPDFTPGEFRVSAGALRAATQIVPAEDLAIIRRAADNIRDFHERQKQKSWFVPRDDGSIFGQMVRPVDRAGLYVPGGRGGSTPLISSLLMNAIPALAAGVPEIAVISPPMPDGRINAHILAAARLLGITEVYAAGSAWAVAALAYGAGPLRPVDVIAGPGNMYVATAKRLLLGRVGIDMIAGPSEICIIADSHARPDWIAADMLSQAEHDPLASAVCLCVDAPPASPDMAEALRAELARQTALLPRADTARASLENFGAIVQVPTLDLAVEIANALAPEHLELLMDDSWRVLPRIRNAGAVFLGPYSPEPVGDYFAGPNHVLPTMGTARFSSALGVDTFCKRISVVAASPAFTRGGAGSVARLARLEGLEAHARSVLCRLDGSK